jgi:hypothetical protein
VLDEVQSIKSQIDVAKKAVNSNVTGLLEMFTESGSAKSVSDHEQSNLNSNTRSSNLFSATNNKKSEKRKNKDD